jgi:hypothetical protein
LMKIELVSRGVAPLGLRYNSADTHFRVIS